MRLAEPKGATVGQRALRAGEAPILQATAGRVMELTLEEEGSGESPPVALDATPINVAVPDAQAHDTQAPHAEESRTESSESVEIVKVVDSPEQDSRATKRKKPMSGDDVASSSRRKRHVIHAETSSTKPASGYESQADAEKDMTESPPRM